MRKLLQLIVALLLSLPVLAQHGAHINAGALASEPGSQLTIVNGAGFSTNSGFVLRMNEGAPGTPYDGLYFASFSFTSLPATPNTGGPAPGHAAIGAFLELRAVALLGPDGAELAFWSEDEGAASLTRFFGIITGETNGAQQINISEPEAAPDPYGHIHGRRMTLNKPGLYTVGFQVVDTSAAGPANGPIHPASEIFWMYFQAGIAIDSVNLEAGQAHIAFGVDASRTYQVEAASELKSTGTVWTSVGPPISGMSGMQVVVDPNGAQRQRFYRLKVTEP